MGLYADEIKELKEELAERHDDIVVYIMEKELLSRRLADLERRTKWLNVEARKLAGFFESHVSTVDMTNEEFESVRQIRTLLRP